MPTKLSRLDLKSMSFILASLLITVLILPLNLRAENSSLSNNDSVTGQESVVISPQDQPLIRQAKLKRAWIVYREMESKDIYAITKSKTKRAIKTLDFFTAFNANYHIKLVAADRLAVYTTGEPVTTAEGLNPDEFVKAPWQWRLVKIKSEPAVYLITPDGKKRVVLAAGVFHRFGWEFRDVEEVAAAAIATLPSAEAITDNTVFDEDVNVKATQQRLQSEQLQKRLELKGKKQVRQRLIKTSGDNKVYLIDANGKKHLIKSEAAVKKHGLNLKEITEVTKEELDALPLAGEINEGKTLLNLNQIIK